MRTMRILCLAIGACSLVAAGCAKTTMETTTVTTTESSRCAGMDDDADTPPAQVCTTVEKTTEISTRPDPCHGVVSCSFFVAGEVITLPFRILGGITSVVF